jgi:hypothetical protein
MKEWVVARALATSGLLEPAVLADRLSTPHNSADDETIYLVSSWREKS